MNHSILDAIIESSPYALTSIVLSVLILLQVWELSDVHYENELRVGCFQVRSPFLY